MGEDERGRSRNVVASASILPVFSMFGPANHDRVVLKVRDLAEVGSDEKNKIVLEKISQNDGMASNDKMGL